MIYFTKENITFVLAVIGSIGTISGWLYTYLTTRKNIVIRTIAYNAVQNQALFYLSFENKSRLSISITSLSLKINGVYYPSRIIPQRVKSSQYKRGNEILNAHDDFSITFPIVISPLGATSGYVLFVFPPGVSIPDTKDLMLQISSNRGGAIETILSLSQLPDTLL
ncbi:hypothetical protein [Diplocloster agilis]|uniref:hypothetical protein n=1 Tax=Diplocloster agilis TaxID=2850323 RepID=UPI0008231D09|nr:MULTISPECIES: hypothetical protein [Lachnospiraceae]MCU6736466.1 hypothetical protein [Suonthocola fibrivorans]SCJ90815.1 Uncharacterised protein [uncultured Clostridium sp.]